MALDTSDEFITAATETVLLSSESGLMYINKITYHFGAHIGGPIQFLMAFLFFFVTIDILKIVSSMIIRSNYQNSDSFADLPQICHRIHVFFFRKIFFSRQDSLFFQNFIIEFFLLC